MDKNCGSLFWATLYTCIRAIKCFILSVRLSRVYDLLKIGKL